MENFSIPFGDASPNNQRKGLKRRGTNKNGAIYAISDPALEINQPPRLYNEGAEINQPPRLYNEGAGNLSHLPRPPPGLPIWYGQRDLVDHAAMEHSGHPSPSYPNHGPVDYRPLEHRDAWNPNVAPNRPHRRSSQPHTYSPGMYNGPGLNDYFQSAYHGSNQNTGHLPTVSDALQSPHNSGLLIVNSASLSRPNPDTPAVDSTPQSRLNPEAQAFVPAKEHEEGQPAYDRPNQQFDEKEVQNRS